MDDAEKAKYRADIYPMGKIPCLFADDNRMIPESSIIIEYLVNEHGSGLIPSDPSAARQTRFMDRMYDNYLNNPVATLLFQSWRPEDQRDQERIDQAQVWVDCSYRMMNKKLADNEWTMGEQFTMADCAAASPLFYAQQSAPFTDYPNIVAYWERLAARPSVSKRFDELSPYLEALKQRQAAA